MHVLPTLVYCLLSATVSVFALPCVVFDAGWNLYAFGVQGQNDWSLGTQDTWGSGGGNVTTTSKENAPPFNGNNTQCFFAEFFNAIYVIDGDEANPTNVHIFDAASQTWTIQSVDGAGVDPTSITAILDHDTNVLFGVQGNQLYQLDMSSQVKAVSQTLKWDGVNQVGFTTTGWTPTLGFADNHIYFIGVPGNSAGQADIFVIHYAYFQPEAQMYTPQSGNPFPSVAGKTATLWEASTGFSVPQQFAFFPNDNSGTYVVDVIHNITVGFSAPPAPASGSGVAFAGSMTAVVELTPDGEIFYLPINQSDLTSGTSATWTKVPNNLWTANPPPISSSGVASSSTGAAQSAHTSSSSSSSKSAAAGGFRADVLCLLAAFVGGLAAGTLV